MEIIVKSEKRGKYVSGLLLNKIDVHFFASLPDVRFLWTYTEEKIGWIGFPAKNLLPFNFLESGKVEKMVLCTIMHIFSWYFKK